MRPPPVEAIAIVVPARDEEPLISECLAALARARDQLADELRLSSAKHREHGALGAPRAPQAPRVITIVVDDGSADGTAACAARFAEVVVATAPGGNVGRARAIGIDRALAELHSDPARVWIANTDADSAVPQHWLTEQLRLADAGADAVIGTVRPAFDDLSAEQIDAWYLAHPAAHTGALIYGANLGVRADSYLRVGGFAPLAEHEDVDLVARLRETGAHLVASNALEVVTSGRRFGRTPGGFAGYLRTQLMPTEGVVR
ncbi:glycosyltransferase [Subtercola lobariae]|uniref:4,4'-diaponeurosporenoate glycosyltransferase n=1 Tax=Subtercola lobariae TaxID=1588641 RepID=A0A917BCC4_9MICO|nr:glycosyltransferase [Subtercola lobariae]GGF33161.1 hypothetical protein GCM10011399_27860 [Subtercola lobariae]